MSSVVVNDGNDVSLLGGGKVPRRSVNSVNGYRSGSQQFHDPFFAGLFLLNTVFIFATSMVS